MGMADDSPASSMKYRMLNNPGTEWIFTPRVDVLLKADQLLQEHGNVYGRPALSGDARPTFRGHYTVIDRSGVIKKAEGEAREELYMRMQELQTKRFTAVARKLFGT